MWGTVRPEMRSWDCSPALTRRLILLLLSYFVLLPCLQCARSVSVPIKLVEFFLGILLACAFSHSFSFRLFICVLKRRKPPGIDLLVIGESNSSTQKGMNCLQGFRSSLLQLKTFVNSFKRACVCMCMCVCLVLTTDGKQCKFPFRFGGTVYHQCIPLNSNSKAW